MRIIIEILFISILCVHLIILDAQEVISSTGFSFSGGGYEISWTVGEPVINTFSGSDVILTQGFHQANISVTGISSPGIHGLELKVYPNPFNEILNLEISGRDEVKFKYRLYAVDGRLLKEKIITIYPEEINMLQYRSGVYFLKVSTLSNIPVQTFKIVKN